jgi:hypothetical protein
MNLPTTLLARLHWLNLPGALLIALLQRTPVLRVLATGAEHLATSPAGQIMRSVFTLGALGALHSRAGATTFIASQGTSQIINVSTVRGSVPRRNPASGTTNTAITPVAFTYTGTPSTPQYFAITGQLPPGLSFVPAPTGATSATLGVVRSPSPSIAGTPTQPGTYTVNVQGFGTGGNGQPESIVFNITGTTSAVTPSFSAQPESQSVLAGSTVTLSATAGGSPSPTYQWRRNGATLAGATSSTLTLASVQAADAGDYTVVATNSAGSATSASATLAVLTSSAGARLANLSVRTAMADGQTLIVGVVVNDGARNVLVRAAGPALAAFGLNAAMADPQLELYDAQATRVLANDNWALDLAPTFASVGAFAFADRSRDAAFIQRLDARYTIQARGTGPGVILVEAYDTGAPTAARLVNVSARNRVGTGDDILIAGFNISGTGPKALLIRAIGPRLGAFGVTGLLTDPKLEIYDRTGAKVAENDNWANSLAATFASVGAFALESGSRDAALLTSLPPGTYTAQVSGANGGTGEALIEIYEVR